MIKGMSGMRAFSRMLKKPVSVRRPFFGLFGLSRVFG
jgi:hypothetical protein